MRVYRNQNLTVLVQPGNEHPETSEFMTKEGDAVMFSVLFANNRAEVSDAVGQYMIDEKLAFKNLAAARANEPVILTHA